MQLWECSTIILLVKCIKFIYVDSPLHSIRSYFIIVYNPCTKLLGLFCWYFVDCLHLYSMSYGVHFSIFAMSLSPLGHLGLIICISKWFLPTGFWRFLRKISVNYCLQGWLYLPVTLWFELCFAGLLNLIKSFTK